MKELNTVEVQDVNGGLIFTAAAIVIVYAAGYAAGRASK